MTIYRVTTSFDEFCFSANLSEASAPIRFIDALGDETWTPFQTADARHRPLRAARLLIAHCGRDYWLAEDAVIGEDDDGETFDGLSEAKYIDKQIFSVEAEADYGEDVEDDEAE